jgi:hypothetical protein
VRPAADSRIAAPDTLVSVDNVMLILQQSKAKFKFCFMNACQEIVQQRNTGVLKSGSGDIYGALAVPLPKNRSQQGGGITRMFACAEGQNSNGGYRNEWNDPEKKWYGYYTRTLIEGLKGDADEDKNGTITFFELTRFATAEVQKMFQGAAFADSQDPNAMLDLTGDPVLAVVPLNGLLYDLLREKWNILNSVNKKAQNLNECFALVLNGKPVSVKNQRDVDDILGSEEEFSAAAGTLKFESVADLTEIRAITQQCRSRFSQRQIIAKLIKHCRKIKGGGKQTVA